MNIRTIVMIFLVSFSSLFAGVQDHFKKALNKSGNHKMRNIDFVYVINLDKRPEKFASCTAQLHPYGIFPYRFSAVNGWEDLTLDDINDVGVKYESWMTKGHWGTCYLPEDKGQPHHELVNVIGRTYFCHCMSRGAVGIVLSHLSILQDAYDSGYETIWVMEDDIQVIRDPHLVSECIDKLDDATSKKWDILFTDRDTKNNSGAYVPCSAYAWRPNFSPQHPERFRLKKPIASGFRRIGARYGAYSMIVRRAGMKKILDHIKTHHIFLPYDMDFYLPNNVRMYTVIDDIVSTQIGAPSDNGGANYEKKQ